MMLFRSESGPPGYSFHCRRLKLAFTNGIRQAGTRQDIGDEHEQG